VDKAVRNGIVKPGRYLVLEFDFSRVIRDRQIVESVEGLRREISRGLSVFMTQYADRLGPSFASATSGFVQNDPAGNLSDLVLAVSHALQCIQEKGEKDDALRGVRGVCLFQTTAHHNANT